MNKNIKLLLGLGLVFWLSLFLFEDGLNTFAATWYGYGYWYWSGISVTNWGTYYQRWFFTWTEQVVLTNYGLVWITKYSTWSVIKLLDLWIYLDRSNPKQDVFGNIWKLQSKWVKSIPTVGAELSKIDN